MVNCSFPALALSRSGTMKVLVLNAFVAILFLAVACLAVRGQPVQWRAEQGGNGHFYEPVLLASPISWFDAEEAARDADGYLVTLTASSENRFVFDLIMDSTFWVKESGSALGPWIGAFQVASASEPDGGWRWVDGEPLVFENWRIRQPDNGGNIEHFAHFYSFNLQDPSRRPLGMM